MKKLFFLAALAGLALIGYTATAAETDNNTTAKPTIVLSAYGSAAMGTITVTASEPVPETVICEGDSPASFWAATLYTGERSVTIPVSGMSYDAAWLDKIVVNGQLYRIELGPVTTSLATYVLY